LQAATKKKVDLFCNSLKQQYWRWALKSV